MKKYSTMILVTAVLMIIVSGNFVFKSWDAYAIESVQTSDSAPVEVMKESTDGATMKEKSEYVLPYPGILPDHPLYFLKDLRDKIIEMLIVDPERKSEFYLLQSDKFLNATQSLLEKNQTEKANEILSKSTERMSMAVSQLGAMKTGGRQVPAGDIDRTQNAIGKHLEVLTTLSSKLKTSDAISSLQKTEDELMKLK